MFYPHGTGPWSEYKKSQIVRGAKNLFYKNTTIIVDKCSNKLRDKKVENINCNVVLAAAIEIQAPRVVLPTIFKVDAELRTDCR